MEWIRRELPYAVGLLILHSNAVWAGAKTAWRMDLAEQDAQFLVAHAAHVAALDSGAMEEDEELFAD